MAMLKHLVRLIRATPSLVRTTMTAAGMELLKVGDELCKRHCFTEVDVVGYAGVSGDRNPVHLDAAFAREVCGFDGGRVVHGMLVASLFSSLIASHFPGAVYASQSLKFVAPVYVGGEVLAQIQVLHIRSSAPARYIVKFRTRCFTDGDQSLAIDGEAMAMLPTLLAQ